MSRPRIAFSVVSLLWLPQAATAQQTPAGPLPSVAEWRHDVAGIVNDILLLHPNPFTKIGKLAFLREAEKLKEAIPSLHEEQRVVGAMRLVALLGDGQTRLEPDNPAFAYWYPVRLYEFTDGVFVTSAHKSVSGLAGAQVLELGGRPVGEVLVEARRLIGADNTFGSLERLYAVHSAGLMKGLGYAGPAGELSVKCRLHDGKVVEQTLYPARTDNPKYAGEEATFEWQYRTEMYGLPFGTDGDWLSAYGGLAASAFDTTDETRPPRLADQHWYYARSLPAQSAYYIRTNYVTDYDFVQFFQRALLEVDELKPRRLILDWRYNFGGDGAKVNFMINEFIKRSDHRPWKGLYILTGRKTFGAAVMALNLFLKHIEVTIVGEPSGSPLNQFGDATTRTYPRTGLRLHVSTLWHQLSSSDDLAQFIPVDVPALLSFADYEAGRDPAVDRIVQGEEMRSIPVIASSDGGAAARKVYEARKSLFGGFNWWTPPKEVDLRNVCTSLLEQKRTADGLETCKLSTEIHPWNWHSWFNLALAQRAAGLLKERTGSARCTLAVDPTNFNAPSIRQLLAKQDPKNEVPVAPGCPTR